MRFLFVVLVGLEVAACSGSSNGNAIDPDGGVPGTHERDAEDVGPDDAFWQAIQVDGNWVEFYPTITELALGSDIVAYGSFVSVRPGTDVQGDAPEDLVRQPVFAVEGEVWKGAARDAIVEVGVVNAKPLGELERMLPSARALVFIRERADDRGYRFVNGYGVWAATPRAIVDAPLNPFPPDEDIHGEEVSQFASLEALVEFVRGAVDAE